MEGSIGWLGTMLAGMLAGFAFGMLMGMGVEKAGFDDRCRKGFHWKDLEYSYSCNAVERP